MAIFKKLNALKLITGIALLNAIALSGVFANEIEIDTLLPASIEQSSSPKNYSGMYSLYFGGLLIANAQVTITTQDQSYHLYMDITPSGIVDFVSDFKAGAKFEGDILENRLQPRSTRTSWVNRDGEAEFANLIYENGRALSFETNNKWAKTRADSEQIDIETITTQTIDPISSMFAAAGSSPCARKQTIFDGLRLSTLTPVNEDKEQSALKCNIAWLPIAGVREKSVKFAQTMAPIRAKFTKIEHIGFLVPENIIIETRYGYVSVRLAKPFTNTALNNQDTRPPF
jgi:hypothetical protein